MTTAGAHTRALILLVAVGGGTASCARSTTASARPAAAQPATSTGTAGGLGGEDPRHLLAVLDYVASDYGGAVADGQVRSATEYAEQLSLLADAAALARTLPRRAGADPAVEVAAIAEAVGRRAPAATVAGLCQGVRQRLVHAYGVVLIPTQIPSFEHGRALFAHSCMQCHGEAGDGGGPDAAKYTPRPANFHDAERMAGLSPLRAFNVLTYGVKGTAMASFDAYPETDRWDLAFYVFTLGHDGSAAARGETLAGRRSLAPAAPTHLAKATDGDLLAAARLAGFSDDDAADFLAYLRRRATYQPPPAGYEVARADVGEAVAAYQAGDPARARRMAVGAYLDGFEPHEAALRVANAPLVDETEKAFLDLRSAVDQGAAVREVQARAVRVLGTLALADDAHQQSATAGGVAAAAAVIVVREGLEAVLLIALLLGVLRKAEAAPTAARWVHAGWLAAVALGLATYWASGRILPSSGRGRELGEGLVGLLAAVLLFAGGHWLLARKDAARRIRRLSAHASAAARGGRVALLGGLAFLAVYREAVEVVLFLRALSTDEGARPLPVLAGLLGGAAALALLVAAFARFGKRLRPGPLLTASGLLLCGLAIVFAGQGVRALQEAGVVSVLPAPGPHIPSLGLYPSWATLLPQALLLAALLTSIGYVWLAARRAAE